MFVYFSLFSDSDICISCGSLNVSLEHPLFVGAMCQGCKVRWKKWNKVFLMDLYDYYLVNSNENVSEIR